MQSYQEVHHTWSCLVSQYPESCLEDQCNSMNYRSIIDSVLLDNQHKHVFAISITTVACSLPYNVRDRSSFFQNTIFLNNITTTYDYFIKFYI